MGVGGGRGRRRVRGSIGRRRGGRVGGHDRVGWFGRSWKRVRIPRNRGFCPPPVVLPFERGPFPPPPLPPSPDGSVEAGSIGPVCSPVRSARPLTVLWPSGVSPAFFVSFALAFSGLNFDLTSESRTTATFSGALASGQQDRRGDGSDQNRTGAGDQRLARGMSCPASTVPDAPPVSVPSPSASLLPAPSAGSGCSIPGPVVAVDPAGLAMTSRNSQAAGDDRRLGPVGNPGFGHLRSQPGSSSSRPDGVRATRRRSPLDPTGSIRHAYFAVGPPAFRDATEGPHQPASGLARAEAGPLRSGWATAFDFISATEAILRRSSCVQFLAGEGLRDARASGRWPPDRSLPRGGARGSASGSIQGRSESSPRNGADASPEPTRKDDLLRLAITS